MTIDQFNKKYENHLEDGHYGLAIGAPEFVKWLDAKFEEFIKKPDFKFSQIKAKFGYGRFYCEGLTNEEIYEVEQKITDLHSGTKLEF